MQLSIAFHIIGFVLWVGGSIILARALAVAVAEGSDAPVRNWAWSGFVGYIVPGAILTLVTGIYQLLTRGMPFYFAQGWFHAKLTLVLVMLVGTLILGIKAKAMSRGELVKKGALMAVHGIAALMLIGGVLLTILGRA